MNIKNNYLGQNETYTDYYITCFNKKTDQPV